MSAGMSIVVVRHGQTPLNAARVLQTEDTPLSDLGVRQAQQLAAGLQELQVVRVLCSDYLRTRMTIAPFETLHGVRAELHPELRERHFGELRGRPYGDIPNVFAPEYLPPGGESWPVFERRVDDAWQIITRVAAETSGVVAVVTHGLVCSSLLRRHWQQPDGLTDSGSFRNASVSVVDRESPHRVRLLNSVDHLEDEAARVRE